MKAKDLMIGDWVYGLYPNGERYANPFRISVIDIYPLNRSPRIVTMGGYGFRQEHLAPVLLTPEILEKNGFKIVHGFGYSESYPTYGWGYHKGLRDYASVDVTFYDEPIGGVSKLVKMETASKKDDGINSIHSCDIEFVHQLQRALRLVGIDKEIII